jgi:hypothetical protein
VANDGATQLGMTPQFYPGEPKALRDSGGIPTLGLSADQVLKRLQPSVALFQPLFIPPSRRRCLHPRQAQLQQIHLHLGIARSLS